MRDIRTHCRGLLIGIGFLIIGSALVHGAPKGGTSGDADNAGWKRVSQSAGLSIHIRSHKEPGIQEVKATGVVDAVPAVVRRVLEDTDAYPDFMPYVIESRVVARQGGAVSVYQRLSPSLMKDMDYTMRMRFEQYRAEAGGVGHWIRWSEANDSGPAEKKGVARLKVNEGYWLIEPTTTSGQTRLTYWLYSDCGRVMPPGFAGVATRSSIPKIFEGVRKQVRVRRYSAGK